MTTSASVTVNLGSIDWALLRKQKHALEQLIAHDFKHILWGVVTLLDHIQDQAEEQGLLAYPEDPEVEEPAQT